MFKGPNRAAGGSCSGAGNIPRLYPDTPPWMANPQNIEAGDQWERDELCNYGSSGFKIQQIRSE
jgi:hypothetical protein